ncbi:MAG: uracil-DNA glycosylase [Syntrophomonadaceae bacterium]|nr:uracil-DNA glycosylase [Syntrophomonadaceae bacterium]
MSKEQPCLFGEMEAAAPEPIQPVGPPKKIYTSFLPGLKAEDGYPQIQTYDELADMSVSCQKCRLRSTCRQVVFGDGDINTDILFVGEGPGKDEDEQGLPFVGRAGQLLNKILEAAEFKRREVYITNVVKCRPPGNRLPNPDEARECRNYLEAQIRIINPRIIVCLGAMACQTVVDPKAKITQTRGKWFNRNGIMIMATYHPAALLRNEQYKRPTWEDFKLIRDQYKKLSGSI